MPIRAVTFAGGGTLWDDDLQLFADAREALASLAGQFVLGLVVAERNGHLGPSDLSDAFELRLVADSVGILAPDHRLFTMASAAARCRPAELVHVGSDLEADVVAPQDAGAQSVWLTRTGRSLPASVVPDATVTSLTELPVVLAGLDARRTAESEPIGVGPHPAPWPDDPRLDPRLLANGDRRNVVDRYRYWRLEAVLADLDARRHPFHVAIENWQHDLNIGTVVRNANAFLAASVRVVGRRRWNRRGAMVTDRYQHVEHHASIGDLAAWAAEEELPIVAVDNLPGAVPIDGIGLPRRCVLLFGQEGSGLSAGARDVAQIACSIRQFGSTRSINAGVASGIAMHAWTLQHAGQPTSTCMEGPDPSPVGSPT